MFLNDQMFLVLLHQTLEKAYEYLEKSFLLNFKIFLTQMIIIKIKLYVYFLFHFFRILNQELDNQHL